MTPTRSLAGVKLLSTLGAVTAITFGGGLLFATTFSGSLPQSTPARGEESCSTCPSMLPCGMPLTGSDWGSATCEFPEK